MYNEMLSTGRSSSLFSYSQGSISSLHDTMPRTKTLGQLSYVFWTILECHCSMSMFFSFIVPLPSIWSTIRILCGCWAFHHTFIGQVDMYSFSLKFQSMVEVYVLLMYVLDPAVFSIHFTVAFLASQLPFNQILEFTEKRSKSASKFPWVTTLHFMIIFTFYFLFTFWPRL